MKPKTNSFHVTIFFSWFTTGGESLAGFMVFVSNTDKTSNWESTEKCYGYPNISTIPDNRGVSRLTESCSNQIAGRYVTIYVERLPGQGYPSTWSSSAILILCEVEIDATGRISMCFNKQYIKAKVNQQIHIIP